MRRRSIFWFLYPPYLIAAVLTLATVAWYAAHIAQRQQYARARDELRAVAALTVLQVGAAAPELEETAVHDLCRKLAGATGYRFTLVRANGTVIADSERDPRLMEDHSDRSEIQDAFREGEGVSVRFSNTLRRNMMYVALPVRADGRVPAVARVSRSLAGVDDEIAGLRRQLMLAAFLGAVAAAVISAIVARRISVPLARLREGAEEFARGRLEAEVPVSGVAEVSILAETMRGMARQLEARILTITRQRDEQEAVFSCMLEAVLAVDEKMRLIRFNEAASELLRVDRGALGRSILEIVRNADLHEIIRHTLNSRHPVEGAVTIPDEDRYLQAHGTVLRGEEGRQAGAVIVLSDVTRLRRLETMRRDFVANVSHELKTPITSVKGFAETLLDGAADNPGDLRRFLAIIARQADRLQKILDDLLTLSSIEHSDEREGVEVQNGRLAGIVENAARTCRAAADAKRIAVHLSCSRDLSARVNVQLIEQAVVNLLDNAIKYSPEGTRVDVSVGREGADLVIRVADQGPGISAEHLPRLFERFYRVDKGRSRKLGGTGLGLAIVKCIAQAHGGRVGVESVVGEGSTFSVFLPLA